MRVLTGLQTCTCALLLGTAGNVFAQAAAPSERNNAAASVGLEEIIVQARRRDESIQSVPLSVTAFSGEVLQEQSIVDVQDLTRSVPNLTVSPSAGRRDTATFGIRSQRNLQDGIDADPSVGVYFSELYVARPYGINQSFYDMQSVQVLKGPQGTLFGRNTTGGAVLLQPERPQIGKFGGSVEGQYTNFDGRLFNGAVNLPLGDTLAVRIAGQTERRDGFTDNLQDGTELDSVDYYAYRASVLFEPNSRFTNYTLVDVYRSDDDGTANFLAAIRPDTGGVTDLFLPDVADEVAAQAERGVHRVDLDGDNFSDVETTTAVNTSQFELNGVVVKNILGWRRSELDGATDFDGSPFPLLQISFRPHAEQFSEELQVQGKSLNDALNWIAGVYYFNEDGADVTNYDFGGFFAGSAGGDAENTSRSAFAQATYTFPNVPALSATAGLRYSWDKRRVNVRPRIEALGGCIFTDANGVPVCSFEVEDEWSAPTWLVGLDYRASENTLLYLSHRRGYRSGGFNLTAQSFAELVPGYDPETITDIELGVKSDWRLGRVPVRANVAVYYGKGDDLQRPVFVGTAGTLRIINAAEATFYGVEFEGAMEPVEGLTVSMFYSYDRGEYDDFLFENPAAPGAFLDVTDSKFPSAPENKLGVGLRYEAALPAALGTLAFGTNYFWQDETYFDALSVLNPESRIDSYETLNVRVEWNDIAGSNVQAAVFARNALDKEYAAGGAGSAADDGFVTNQSGEPRIYGLSLRYDFGK